MNFTNLVLPPIISVQNAKSLEIDSGAANVQMVLMSKWYLTNVTKLVKI